MFKSYFWVLHLAMIAAGAYFIADMANVAIGSRLEASIAPKSAGNSGDTPVVASKGPRRDYNAIVEGNIFNSKMRGKQPEVAGLSMDTALPAMSPPSVPLNQTLLGTMVGSDDESYAVIEDNKTREQLLYRIGDILGEDARITKISRNKVVVRRGGEEEILEVSLSPEENKPAPHATPTVLTPSTPSTLGSNIRPAGKNRWVMDRREIENAVDNLPQLLTKARIVPNFSEGKPDGFRIFAITEDSLYAKIGLQNGDVLHRVNGIEVKDPQNFLKVFEQLKDESAITVDLVRNNQKETFSYEIR
jgi:general secretion pathway protein C